MTIEAIADGAVLRIGIRRPEKMNALSRAMFHEFAAALHRLEHDPALRVGLVWAEGPHFTAGVDLADWVEAFGAGKPFPVSASEIDPFAMSGPRLSKPLVVAVQGRCYTWGWEFLLNTEIRVAARDTRFAMLEVRRGFYACGGATLRLPGEIGWGNAQRFLLTGDEMPAEEAYRLGMVQALCEPGEQLDRAAELAGRVASAAPLGVQGSLRSSRTRMLEGEEAAIAVTFAGMREVMQSEDAAEGVRSFVAPAKLTQRPQALLRSAATIRRTDRQRSRGRRSAHASGRPRRYWRPDATTATGARKLL